MSLAAWSFVSKCSETVASRNLFVDRLLAEKPFFHFGYLLKLSCSCTTATKWKTTTVTIKFHFLFFQNWMLIWFFVEERVAKEFVDGCVYDSSCRLLQRTTGKIFWHLKFLTIRVLLLPPQNEVQLLSRFFRYWKMFFLFGFWAEDNFDTEFNESESWTCRLFTAEHTEKFLTSVLFSKTMETDSKHKNRPNSPFG